MNCENLRVVFAGTPEFAVPTLQSLIDSTHNVVGVYSQPDRPAGRGRKLTASAVKQCALSAGLPVFQPLNFTQQDAVDELAELQADVMVVVAYGLLLPESVLALPALGCVNVHASLLPRWRGAAPLQRSILAGDRTTGVTIMLMDKGLDTGPMLAKTEVPMTAETSTAILHDQLAELGGNLLLEALAELCNGELEPVPQPDSVKAGSAAKTFSSADICYAAKLSKSEAVIDWSASAAEIHRKVLAFNPWPVAQTTLEGHVLRIWKSRLPNEAAENASTSSGSDEVAGTIFSVDKQGIWVACGDGVLLLESVQPPGKKSMSARDFAQARELVNLQLGVD